MVVSEGGRQLLLPRGLLVLLDEIKMVIHILHSRSLAARDCSNQQSFAVLHKVIALDPRPVNSLPEYSSRVRAEAVVIQNESIIWTLHLDKRYVNSLRDFFQKCCNCDSDVVRLKLEDCDPRKVRASAQVIPSSKRVKHLSRASNILPQTCL